MDRLTTYRFTVGDRVVHKRTVGGLLGHWAVGTHAACELLRQCHRAIERSEDSALPGQSTTSQHQADEIDRVCRQYPDLVDDACVRQHLEEWLA